MIGTRLGNYQLLDCIGAGGMGAVYVAEHRALGRRAAVKVLLPELTHRQDAVDRFFQEARAIAAIGDPGVVQIFDFGHEQGCAYLVMELLAGESLERRLGRLGRLPARDAVRVARQIATTLAAAHAAGIVHRDVKPDNLFLVRDAEAETGERAKVLDFGIAKLAGGTGVSSRTSTGVVMGTPLYMAPEQCRGAGGVDHRADIYALGCVLFHAVCGRPPFEAEGAGEVIARHLMEAAPRAASVVPGIPPELDEIIARCLAKAPDDRFADMATLAATLGALSSRLTGAGLATVMAPSATTLGLASGQTQPRRSGVLGAGLIAVAVAIAAATVYVATRGAEPAAPEPAAVAAPVPIDAGPDAAVRVPDATVPLDAAPVADAPTPTPTPEPHRPKPHGKPRPRPIVKEEENPYDRP